MNVKTPRVVGIGQQHLPATKKPARRWRRLDQLASEADRLVKRYGELRETQEQIWWLGEASDAELSGRAVPSFDYSPLDDDDREVLAYCQEAFSILDPKENYDEDGELRRHVLAERLAVLVGSYPAGSPADPDAYTAMLLEHVSAVDGLNYVALDAACREVAEAKPFLPAPAELLKAVRHQQVLWEKRKQAIDCIEWQARTVIEEITKLKPRLEAVAAKRRLARARYEMNSAAIHARAASRAVVEKQQASAMAANAVAVAFGSLVKSQERVAQRMRELEEAEALLANFKIEST